MSDRRLVLVAKTTNGYNLHSYYDTIYTHTMNSDFKISLMPAERRSITMFRSSV